MDDEALIGWIQRSELPKPIRKHLVAQIRAGKRTQWHSALEERGTDFVPELNWQLGEAATLVGLSVQQLLKATDFSPKDLALDRLDSALAEIRAIHWLHGQGFTELAIIPARGGGASADLLGARHGIRYSFEVACASRLSPRYVEQLPAFLEGRLLQKAHQATAGLNVAGRQITRCGLLVIVNSEPAIHLAYQEEYAGAIQRALEMADAPRNFHLAIITGRVAFVRHGDGTTFYGPDDIVLPPWPGEAATAEGAS